jgi:hypothetical protein
MNKNMMKRMILFSLAGLFLLSCKQGDPEFNNRVGDELTFAGRKWDIKVYNDIVWGPGPNYFTNHPNDVFIDDDGYLHLSVTERNGKWRCTEVISQDAMGYGTYIWTLRGNPVNIDRNIVIGLFTWDDFTFQTDANSEVDIEFSKWGVEEQDTTLQYGVQPIKFGTYYPERDYKPKAEPSLWNGVSTHAFTWTPDSITWASWQGDQYGNGEPLASWKFDLNNPPREKEENGNISDPIIIPAPGNNTNARMNMWLVNGPQGPFLQVRHEIIIQNFEYIPYP